jgi:hypothetical protein
LQVIPDAGGGEPNKPWARLPLVAQPQAEKRRACFSACKEQLPAPQKGPDHSPRKFSRTGVAI